MAHGSRLMFLAHGQKKKGREPSYWANMTRTKAREIHFSESKKAKQWIEERKELLEKKGITDHEFLNTLVKEHLVWDACI